VDTENTSLEESAVWRYAVPWCILRGMACLFLRVTEAGVLVDSDLQRNLFCGVSHFGKYLPIAS
jgi:hypothetical protein